MTPTMTKTISLKNMLLMSGGRGTAVQCIVQYVQEVVTHFIQ